MRIASVIDYWREILNIHYCEKDEMLFFRGHSEKVTDCCQGLCVAMGKGKRANFITT